MLTLRPRILFLFLLLIATTSNAQYTQMIVDNNNRIMPIFFHDQSMNQQPIQLPDHQTKQSLSEPSFHYPKPPAMPQRTVAPKLRQPSVPRNPLTGPYYISPERHRIMAAAHELLGTPYIYGGNNPSRGLDCSSLMQTIHKRALGVTLPRTAAQQRNRSKTIAFSDLQPGDLLFFKIDRRNNHVGIYIGDGKFIHASASERRATISSMHLPYWNKRFVKFGSYLRS